MDITENTRIASGYFKIAGRTFKYVTFVNLSGNHPEAETVVHSKQGTIIDSFSRSYPHHTVAAVCKKQLEKAKINAKACH